jgi:cytochrome c-type biogenesis protein
VIVASVSDTITSGSLLLALPIAALAGVVSFVSPCVLPLVPGYLSYVTGLSGADLAQRERPCGRRGGRRGRLLAGCALFVLGFSVMFVSAGAVFGGLGRWLLEYADPITRALGAVTIVLGLAFMGFVPRLQRTVKPGGVPAAGLAGAPLLGVVFGLGWTPCTGPVLAAIAGLAGTLGSPIRGAVLAAAYCVGLGVPFLLIALAYRRALLAMGAVRRHRRGVQMAGGAVLVVVGVLLATGLWADLLARLQGMIAGFTPVV